MASRRKARDASLSPPPMRKATGGDIAKELERLTVQPAPEPPAGSMAKTHPHLCAKFERYREQRTPRFLFRAWDRFSGGSSAFNTTDAITPRAFHINLRQPPVWHHSPATIIANSKTHLDEASSPTYSTYFSSWSQSLWTVIGIAMERCDDERSQDTGHISILDTRELQEENFVFYTPRMKQISPDIPHCYRGEFLVYGVVKAPASKRLL